PRNCPNGISFLAGDNGKRHILRNVTLLDRPYMTVALSSNKELKGWKRSRTWTTELIVKRAQH
ncbi:hypothetical protein K1T71_010908, partial [Dendrolimus kikuchii]